MFFKNPGMFPYNYLGVGSGMNPFFGPCGAMGQGTTLGELASAQMMANQRISGLVQQAAMQAGLQHRHSQLKAQLIFGPPQGVARSEVVAQIKELEADLEKLVPTPFSGDPEPAKVEMKQFEGVEQLPEITTSMVKTRQIKDVTPPDQDFECAQCGHPGPKDRLRGCQVCGGMVWK